MKFSAIVIVLSSLIALSNQFHKVENQNVDLQFLNNQYFLKIQRLEKENKLKSDRLQEQQEKNLQAIIQTPAGGHLLE